MNPQNSRQEAMSRMRRLPSPRYRYVRRRWRALFTVVDFFGGILAAAVRAIGRRRNPIAVPRSILVVQLDHLGDAVISLPLIRGLRRLYPSAAIEVLAGAWNDEFFSAVGEVDRVHVSSRNRFSRDTGRGRWLASLLWWGWSLRKRRFDLAIDVRGEFPLALLIWLAGAKRRLGWTSGGGGFLLTDSPPYQPCQPEFERRLALLNLLGWRSQRADADADGRFDPGDDARARIARRMETAGPSLARRAGTVGSSLGRSIGLGDSEPMLVVHIGAGTQAKRWPVEHWISLARRLVDRNSANLVLVGSEGDRRAAHQICRSLQSDHVTDWTGKLSLVELAALIERAGGFIGADSGPAHLAAAIGTPAVVLFSGTNRPQQWSPQGRDLTVVRNLVPCSPCQREVCPWGDHPCMSGLRPESVAQAVADMLEAQAAGVGQQEQRPCEQIRRELE